MKAFDVIANIVIGVLLIIAAFNSDGTEQAVWVATIFLFGISITLERIDRNSRAFFLGVIQAAENAKRIN